MRRWSQRLENFISATCIILNKSLFHDSFSMRLSEQWWFLIVITDEKRDMSINLLCSFSFSSSIPSFLGIVNVTLEKKLSHSERFFCLSSPVSLHLFPVIQCRSARSLILNFSYPFHWFADIPNTLILHVDLKMLMITPYYSLSELYVFSVNEVKLWIWPFNFRNC